MRIQISFVFETIPSGMERDRLLLVAEHDGPTAKLSSNSMALKKYAPHSITSSARASNAGGSRCGGLP